MVGSPESLVDAGMRELVCLWALAMAQSSNGNHSSISMELDLALSSNPLFLEWTQERLNALLGTATQVAMERTHNCGHDGG